MSQSDYFFQLEKEMEALNKAFVDELKSTIEDFVEITVAAYLDDLKLIEPPENNGYSKPPIKRGKNKFRRW